MADKKAELMERRRVLIEEAQEVLDDATEIDDAVERAKAEERFDAMMDDADKLQADASTQEKTEKREKRIADATAGGADAEKRDEDMRTRKTQLAPGISRNPTDDEVEDRVFRMNSFDRYLRKGYGGLSAEQTRVLNESNDTEGGYLVPEDFRNEVIRKLPGFAIIRTNGATTLTTDRDVVTVPRVTGGDNVFTSGVTITWVDELPGEDEGLTEPAFGQERWNVNKAIAKTRLSKDFIDDSAVDIVGLLTTLYAEAFGLGEDREFLTGDGIKKPKGIFVDAGITQVVSGDAADITADGLIDCAYDLPVQYRQGAVWVMRSSTERNIRKLKDGNGQYLWQPGLAVDRPGTILGWPVLGSEFAPAIAAAAEPIMFGRLSGYWIFDRRGMTLQRLVERYAEQGQIAFVVDKRVAGGVAQNFAFRLQTIST